MKKLCLISFFLLFAVIPGWSEIIVTSFAPTLYTSDTTAMNQTFGITGYAFENFEDTNLINSLTMSLDYGTPGNTLPRVETGNDLSWDSGKIFNNYYASTPSEAIGFHFDAGIRSFGVGFANMETRRNPDFSIWVNGNKIVDAVAQLPGYRDTAVTGLQKNIYIRLDSTEDIIYSVVLDWGPQVNDSPGLDGVGIDHAAFDTDLSPLSIPEPMSLFMIIATLIFLKIKCNN